MNSQTLESQKEAFINKKKEGFINCLKKIEQEIGMKKIRKIVGK